MRRAAAFPALLLLLATTAARAQDAPALPAGQEVLAAVLERARASGALSRVLGERAFATWTGEGAARRAVSLTTVLVEDLPEGLRLALTEESVASELRLELTLTLSRAGRVIDVAVVDRSALQRFEGRGIVLGGELLVETRTTAGDAEEPPRRLRHAWPGDVVPDALLRFVLPALADQGLPAATAIRPYDERVLGPAESPLTLSARAVEGGHQVSIGPGPHACTIDVTADLRIARVRPEGAAWESITLAERDRLRDPPATATAAAGRARPAPSCVNEPGGLKNREVIAVSQLAAIAKAQTEFAAFDRDADCKLEAAPTLADLMPLFGKRGKPLAGLSAAAPLDEPAGALAIRGYCFTVAADGARWIAWAWPERPGVTGERIYVVSHQGGGVHRVDAVTTGLDLPAGAIPVKGR